MNQQRPKPLNRNIQICRKLKKSIRRCHKRTLRSKMIRHLVRNLTLQFEFASSPSRERDRRRSHLCSAQDHTQRALESPLLSTEALILLLVSLPHPSTLGILPQHQEQPVNLMNCHLLDVIFSTLDLWISPPSAVKATLLLISVANLPVGAMHPLRVKIPFQSYLLVETSTLLSPQTLLSKPNTMFCTGLSAMQSEHTQVE